MSFRRFTADNDAAAVVTEQWLLPHEQIFWIIAHRPIFDMPRRTKEGKVRYPLPVRILLWIIGFPVMIWLIIASDGETFDDGLSLPPQVVAFGRHRHCQASVIAGHRDGFWVLTNQRFAFLTAVPLDGPAKPSRLSRLRRSAKRLRQGVGSADLPLEPVRVTPVLQVSRGEVAVQGNVERRLRNATVAKGIYDRYVLADGSGFDFWRGHVGR